MFGRKNKMKKATNKEAKLDFILPLYLNQRFVYDILAIKNDGFTEFFEIRDRNENTAKTQASVSAEFGNNNAFSLIQTSVSGEAKLTASNDSDKERTYKKTHTASSLFMQVYQYLNDNNKIKKLQEITDIDKVECGDFVELKSSIELNTVVELFETVDKVIDITEAFGRFAALDAKEPVEDSNISRLKEPVEKVIKILNPDNNTTKYGICKLGEKEVVVKLNKNYFINSDYSEIKNGKFRIIGKVLEVVQEGNEVLLNRENALGSYDPDVFKDVKTAFAKMPKIKVQEFKDIVEGKTIVIMPIAIGI